MQQIQITKELEGQRLDKFLGKYLNDAPKSFIYKMLRKKNIKLNHSKANGNEMLSVGDCIEIYLSDETISNFRKDKVIPVFQSTKFEGQLTHPENKTGDKNPLENIEIIYEDVDVLILNKPVGILSQKATKEDYSLNERIVDYYTSRNDLNLLFTPSVCNRLDRNTSGIILAGMSLKGSRVLSQMLKERILDKYYLTIVLGKIEEPSTIKGFLTKKKSHNQVVIYHSLEEAKINGCEKPAYIETKYEPIAYGKYKKYDFTFLKVKLITGKTHQIRAHLSSANHPIIGDGKYGHKMVNDIIKKEFGLKHQLLHAYEISFPEAYDGESLESLKGSVFHAKLNKQFYLILDAMFNSKEIRKW